MIEDLERQLVASVPFVATDLKGATNLLIRLSQDGSGHHLHLANAYTTVLASTNAQYARVLQDEAVVFPDGRPISWVSAVRRHRPRLKTVPGPDLFEEVMSAGIKYGLRHYLLGSTPAVLRDLEKNLNRKYVGLDIVGTSSPPFRTLTSDELVTQTKEIVSSGAQVVWVGLGTPKQDFEVKRLAQETKCVCVAVGAAFDFSSGHIARAPKWVSTIGMEWLFRFAKEPHRLWRRYMFGNLRFIWLVIAQRDSHRK